MRPPSNCSFGFVLLAGFVLSGFGLQAQQAAPQAGPGLAAPEQQQPLTVDRDPVLSPDPTPVAPPPAAPTAGSGGTPTVQKNNGHYTLERTVDEVVLNATVLDDKDHMVNGLTQADFKVYEDNVPQTIVAFEHQDIPISLGLLVDNSGSMRSKRQAVNQSALDLVHASNPDDETFVVNFSDEAYIDQDFTADVGKLRDGLSHIDSRGGTALYDAVVASTDYMSKNAKRPKQVLLVITDGEDNASSTSLEQTVRRIQDLQGPVVYCIGLLFNSDDGGRESRRARRALQLLSDQTGGLAFFLRILIRLNEIAGQVARDIRQQYTIGYHSTKLASLGGYRAVRLEAKSQGLGKLTVRTKPGYFPTAKPQTASASKNAGN